MKFSLMVRGLSQRIRFCLLPTFSLVPEARPPPKGCRPTKAVVGGRHVAVVVGHHAGAGLAGEHRFAADD